MPRISRIVVPDYPHHITQRGVRSMDVFSSDSDRKSYLSFLAEEISRCGVDILSWCLMTNHVHFIAVPKKENSLARAFGEAHRRYTWMRNCRDGVRGYLFQGRFGSCVLDESHLIAAARYIELNPVRAGLIDKAWNYPWSSARYHIGITDNDPLIQDRTLLGLIDDWQTFLASSEDEKARKNLRKATHTGRPAGGEIFIKTVEQLTGRFLEKGKVGRPKKTRDIN